MRSPLISIITPTWNVANTVERALMSVASQRYTETEHIFIDNSSDDETVSILSDYRKRFKHIRFVSEKDDGIYDAMNKGLNLCTGDWIYFMGADDEFYNEHVLEALFEQGLFQEEQIVYGNVQIKGDASWVKDGTIYDGPFDLEKLFRKNICHQSMFYPRSVIKQVGYFSEKYQITADWDYNIRCFARYKFTYTDHIIALFQGGGRSSEGGVLCFYHDLPENVIKYFNLDPNDNTHLDPNNHNLPNPNSPFYYPLTRYRIEKDIRIIEEQKNENEKFSNQIEALESTHFQNIATLKAQHEESVIKICNEKDNMIQDLKSDHQNATEQILAENEKFIQILKSDHQNVTEQLMAENEKLIQNMKSDHQTASLKLMADNEKLIQDIKSDHLNALTLLITENHQFIQSMNTAHVNEITKLMAENEESRMLLNAKYEQEIELVRNDLDTTKILLQLKERELNQIIENGKQQIDFLSRMIEKNGEEMKNKMKIHEQEISSLKLLISEKEQEINTIRQSYTWKTGRALLFPAQYFLRRVKNKV